VKEIYEKYPTLNVVINNAGRAEVYKLSDESADAFENAFEEILVNYLSIVRLNERLLPLLKKQAEAAIVNVSSIVSIVPGLRLPTYAASKAALHSYSQSLRLTLELAGAPVKVFELRPPLVDTEFSAEIGGSAGIPAYVVADELLTALAEDRYDVRVGRTEDIYNLYLKSPEQALLAMNAPALQKAGVEN
ncbi:MAG: SDR family NAD(P)-dependent oxidoreductase, partial [Bacteroidetes bacterium]|nr:SDR family NAD(P)-dependent oxidoreductase [Bacteroidota bacterium]